MMFCLQQYPNVNTSQRPSKAKHGPGEGGGRRTIWQSADDQKS